MGYEIVSTNSGFARNYSKFIKLMVGLNTSSPALAGIFCLKCRSVNLGSAHTSCQFCGTSFAQKNSARVEKHTQIFGRKRNVEQDVFTIGKVHDSVTMGVLKDDDNNIESINMTFWYRSYAIDAKFKGQRSWRSYIRITMQLKTRQLIMSEMKDSGKITYSHFNIWNNCVLESSFANYRKSDYAKMLKYYLKTLDLCLPNYKVLSPAFIYWYIRYPIVMDMCSIKFSDYLSTVHTIHTCGVDVYLYLIHSVCKGDRTINHLMQSRSYDEFIEHYKQVTGEWYESSMNMHFYEQPMFAVIAHQMKRMGFKKLTSIRRILDVVMTNAVFGDTHINAVSSFIFDLFRQRTHVTNKFFKRFIKAHGEDTTVDMIVNFGLVASNGFKLQVDYVTYQNRDKSGLEWSFMRDFWKYVESNFTNINFNESLYEIYARDFLAYNCAAFNQDILDDAVRRSTMALTSDGHNFDEYHGGERRDL